MYLVAGKSMVLLFFSFPEIHHRYKENMLDWIPGRNACEKVIDMVQPKIYNREDAVNETRFAASYG